MRDDARESGWWMKRSIASRAVGRASGVARRARGGARCECRVFRDAGRRASAARRGDGERVVAVASGCERR